MIRSHFKFIKYTLYAVSSAALGALVAFAPKNMHIGGVLNSVTDTAIADDVGCVGSTGSSGSGDGSGGDGSGDGGGGCSGGCSG